METTADRPPRLDRAVQRSILHALELAYPQVAQPGAMGFNSSDPVWARNVTYLAEHGLAEIKASNSIGGPATVVLAKITAKGLDFLEDDGGLGAILNVLTVRLDAETLRALIEDKVEAANLPPEQKSRIMDWLRKAGQEGLKQATTKLVGAALDHAPEALQLLQRLPDLVP